MLLTRQSRFLVSNFGRRSITAPAHNTKPIGHQKLSKPLERPVRGGQNLSERFKRLEDSLRGKDALKRELVAKSSQTHLTAATAVPSAQTPTFHGFLVPQEPKPPADDECCMSGCAVCVYDLYEESLAAYKDEIHALCKALIRMGIPKSEWPAHVRLDSRNAVSTEMKRKKTVLSTFEEMERVLALRKQRQIEKDRS